MAKSLINVQPELKLDWATHKAAKYACQNWHYSKCMPSGKTVKIGVWEKDIFIGVVIFSMGSGNATRGDKYGLKPKTEVAELARVALTKHTNTVSKIISISIKMLKKQSAGLKMIISFADYERIGHIGTIYQAGNWIYAGMSKSNDVIVIHGERVHRRSVFAKYGINSLVWVKQNIDPSAHFMSNTKHRYIMPLDNETRDRLKHLGKPYPKRVTKANSGDQLESEGAIPIHTLQTHEAA